MAEEYEYVDPNGGVCRTRPNKNGVYDGLMAYFLDRNPSVLSVQWTFDEKEGPCTVRRKAPAPPPVDAVTVNRDDLARILDRDQIPVDQINLYVRLTAALNNSKENPRNA